MAEWLLSLSLLPPMLTSCSDEPEKENYYTFTGKMVSDYLDDRPELYSEFTKILHRSGMYGMMATYGSYTCFAPTNAAVGSYLAQHGLTSVDELTKAECDTLSWNHIIQQAFNHNTFMLCRIASGDCISILLDESGGKGIHIVLNIIAKSC